MRVERASRALGARVQGIDLGEPLDRETFASVRDALNRHSVLVFPEQDVEPPAQVEFSARFGRLKHHVLKENLLPGMPEIYVLTNMTSQNEVKPRPYAGAYWHTDLSYEAEPAFGSVMYAVEVPEVGGDTMFCSMAAAWDALSSGGRLVANSVTLESDLVLGGFVGKAGCTLTRLSVERLDRIGGMRGFRPAMTVTQLRATKP